MRKSQMKLMQPAPNILADPAISSNNIPEDSASIMGHHHDCGNE